MVNTVFSFYFIYQKILLHQSVHFEASSLLLTFLKTPSRTWPMLLENYIMDVRLMAMKGSCFDGWWIFIDMQLIWNHEPCFNGLKLLQWFKPHSLTRYSTAVRFCLFDLFLLSLLTAAWISTDAHVFSTCRLFSFPLSNLNNQFTGQHALFDKV